MLVVDDFKGIDVLNQNCRIGKKYPKNCEANKLCSPQDEFDIIESCKDCNKQI